MINYVYQLIAPHTITQKYRSLSLGDKAIVRPMYMSICHADQRYFTGSRDMAVLKKKLPMALIHEAMGEVVYDPSGTFSVGQKVVMIPNIPGMPVNGVYPNYLLDSKFRSSGYDGFMAELVEIDPDRLVSCEGIDPVYAAITEFISIGFHAVERLEKAASTPLDNIGVWGDGGLGFLVALILRWKYPKSKLYAIGLDEAKLARFTFVDETYHSLSLPEDFRVDHALECCGGTGCYYADNQIIHVCNPQGVLMMLGVSEKEVPLNTRLAMEKGMTLVGCSRSDRPDFEQAVEFLRDKGNQNHIKRIISQVIDVNSVADIYEAFDCDVSNPYKTVLKWNL